MSKDFVVLLRGLPWSTRAEQVMEFLRDCELDGGEDGVHFTLTRGKPSGECFVELASEDDVQNALSQNRKHIGSRYIEVFRVERKEMERRIQRTEAAVSPSRPSGDAVVKLRGLPFGCTEEEITHFFSGLEIVPNGITLPADNFGRSKGVAFVQFASADMAERSLGKDKGHIGQRYVEIFKSDLNEVNSVSRLMRGYVSKTGHSIHMRGLPFEALEQDVVDFFSPIQPVQCEFEYNYNGRKTGKANVDFVTRQDAEEAMKKHKTNMKHRYIELFLNSQPNTQSGGGSGLNTQGRSQT